MARKPTREFHCRYKACGHVSPSLSECVKHQYTHRPHWATGKKIPRTAFSGRAANGRQDAKLGPDPLFAGTVPTMPPMGTPIYTVTHNGITIHGAEAFGVFLVITRDHLLQYPSLTEALLHLSRPAQPEVQPEVQPEAAAVPDNGVCR